MASIVDKQEVLVTTIAITKVFMTLYPIALLLSGMEMDQSRRNAFRGYQFKRCLFHNLFGGHQTV